MLTRLFCKRIVDGYAENQQKYKDLEGNEAGRKKLKSEAWNEFLAILFLRNANQARFGEG